MLTAVQCKRITVDRSFCLKVFWEVLRLATCVWLRLDFSFSNKYFKKGSQSRNGSYHYGR